ncbi:hypothetical protein [Neorhizobium sp. T7_12]|uniref:hypothetical protein n=1 Tax=Neorhizobium sp. T7_12 TaxID=2093832 RepID=UPI000CF9F2FE|nr:hypothetical protein [Neorhizobium sp. T7_12]
MPMINLKDGRNVNTSAVVQYATLKNGDTRFLLSTGCEVTGEAYSDPAELFMPVIPANPGFVAVYAERLSDGSYCYTMRSAIAWKVTFSGSWPLFEGCDRDENSDYLVMMDPSGGVFDSDGNMYSTLEEWKREFETDAVALREAA